MFDLEVGVVVDVAVQHREDERRRAIDLFAGDGMGIGLGDDADTRPTGVADDCHPCAGLGEHMTQNVVGHHLASDGTGVVPEFADLGRCFVHERPDVVGDAQ